MTEHTRTLRNGNAAHELTAEDRRRGGLARAEKLRQAERRRQLLEAATDSMLDGLVKAAMSDPRLALRLLTIAFGPPRMARLTD